MKIAKSIQHGEIKGFKLGSLPFGKPKMYSYFYFIDGLVIDTGHRHMRSYAMEAVEDLAVEQIYITHHHEDHNGNLKPFQEKFRCPTYATAKCAELMKSPTKISFAQWLTWGKTDPNFDIQVEEEVIETPRYRFDLIYVPGHAPDMVCLYEASQGWLFSADLWVKEYIRYFMRSESMIQQIESLEKVLKLDFDVILCSHNPQFSDGKSLMKQKLEFLKEFYGKAEKLYHQGLSAKAIFKQMGLKESKLIKFVSGGELSGLNMVKAVIRDEIERASDPVTQ